MLPGIPDFTDGILDFMENSIDFNVVHRKVDWRNPKMISLNSMPDTVMLCLYFICNYQSVKERSQHI